MDFIAADGELVVAEPLGLELPDSDDEPSLEVAVAASAEALISGNERHFALQDEPRVRICSPAAFVGE